MFGFSVVTFGSELVTCDCKLITQRFELVICRSLLVTCTFESKLTFLNFNFWILFLTSAFLLLTCSSKLIFHVKKKTFTSQPTSNILTCYLIQWHLLTLWFLRARSSGSEVVGGWAPCRVTTWLERKENNAILKKIGWTFKKFKVWHWIRPSFWDMTV